MASEPEAPPHEPVEWHGAEKPYEDSCVTVWAQGWYEARELAAAQLGLPVEQVDVWKGKTMIEALTVAELIEQLQDMPLTHKAFKVVVDDGCNARAIVAVADPWFVIDRGCRALEWAEEDDDGNPSGGERVVLLQMV